MPGIVQICAFQSARDPLGWCPSAGSTTTYIKENVYHNAANEKEKEVSGKEQSLESAQLACHLVVKERAIESRERYFPQTHKLGGKSGV